MNFRRFFTSNIGIGKIIGFILGFIMAGPLGAFFGLLIGSFFDKGLAQQFSAPHWSYRTEKRKEVRSLFVEALFMAMGYIAKANGRITENMIVTAKKMMDELNLTKAQKKEAELFFNQGKLSNAAPSKILIELKTAAYNNQNLLNLLVSLLYQNAQVDGLSNYKMNRFNEVLSLMGFAPLQTQSHFYEDFFYRHRYQDQNAYRQNQNYQYSSYQEPPRNHYKGSLSEAYALLKVSPEATHQEVKKVYRRLMSQHHPDKLIAKSASPKEIKAANEKTQAISRAYEQICESKGW